MDLLSSASEALSGSLERDDVVRKLSRLVVPQLADWSIVYLLDERGQPRPVASWHRDEALRRVVATVVVGPPSNPGDASAVSNALRTGQPVVISSGATQRALALAPSAARDALVRLAPESSATFPLVVGGRLAGVFTAARGGARPAPSAIEVGARPGPRTPCRTDPGQ